MRSTSSPLERSERRLGYALLLPAFLLLIVVVLYPIATLLWTSVHTLQLTQPWLGTPFVGFENFSRAFADKRFWEAVWHTLVFIIITVPGGVLIGLGLALLANRPLRVKWPVRLGLLLPWALPLVFAGLIWRWFFDYNLGLVNAALGLFGIAKQHWLSDPTRATLAISIAIIWKSSSFAALVLLAGLQTIPSEYYESAAIDGANRWQQFRYVTLPMLRPAIVVALVFRTITAIQNFDIPYAMTNGGPGTSTETLAMLIHTTTLEALDFGYGSALAVLMFFVSLIVTSGYLRYTWRERSNKGSPA